MRATARIVRMAAAAARPFLMLGLALSTALPAVCAPRDADPLVREILRRSILAVRRINLRGQQIEMVAGPDGTMTATTRKVVESEDGRSLAICIAPQRERGMVKVSDGRLIREYNSRQRTIHITRPMQCVRDDRDAERQIRRITANYDVQLLRDANIAGRECQIIELRPHSRSGHVIQVWVDRNNGAVLSRQESDLRGNTLALTFFTSVQFPRRIANSELTFRFPNRARKVWMTLSSLYRDVASLRRKAGFDVFLPVAMPPGLEGFELEACEIVLLNGEKAACLRFSDGMTNLTICQSPFRRAPQDVNSILWQPLPRGQAMVLCFYRQTTLMVAGPRDVEALCAIARAVDADRERALLERLAHNSGMPCAALEDIRNRGVMLDTMAALSEISAQTRRRFEALIALYQDGWTWPRIAEQYRANVQRISERVRVYR